jgi:GTP-binding protein
MVPGRPDELTAEVERQALRAVQEAEVVILLVDGRAGRTPLDEMVAASLRRIGRPVLLAVNKIDGPGGEERLAEFFALGFADPIPLSAEEGRGVSTLLDTVVARLPAARDPEADRHPGPAAIRLAIVGRPNVGKSTLFNRLVGEQRAVVSPIPGTTRDPVDAEFRHAGRRYRVVDTAGLRRRARSVGEEVEVESVERALAALKQCDVAMVLVDALDPSTHQDRAVLGACQRVRRPLLVAANRSDLLPGGKPERDRVHSQIRSRLRFAEEAPVLLVSALRGTGVGSLLETLREITEEAFRRMTTPELNRALEAALRRRSPPAVRGRIPRLYYITQTGVAPPSFVVFTNGAPVGETYRRYLARHLRRALGLRMTPVSIKFRRRS